MPKNRFSVIEQIRLRYQAYRHDAWAPFDVWVKKDARTTLSSLSSFIGRVNDLLRDKGEEIEPYLFEALAYHVDVRHTSFTDQLNELRKLGLAYKDGLYPLTEVPVVKTTGSTTPALMRRYATHQGDFNFIEATNRLHHLVSDMLLFMRGREGNGRTVKPNDPDLIIFYRRFIRAYVLWAEAIKTCLVKHHPRRALH